MIVYLLFEEIWANSMYGGYDVHTVLRGVYGTLTAAEHAKKDLVDNDSLRVFISAEEVHN